MATEAKIEEIDVETEKIEKELTTEERLELLEAKMLHVSMFIKATRRHLGKLAYEMKAEKSKVLCLER